MGKKNSHCSYCGAAFPDGAGWPRTCGGCGATSYLNPLPVAVLLVPVDGGLLTVRRAIEPRLGELALPGGYISPGESWQHAGAREVLEETGVTVDPAGVVDFRVLSAPDGTVLIFGEARPLSSVPSLSPNPEVSELVVLGAPAPLAFPLHTQVVNEWFARRRHSESLPRD
jgi:8-oxo-dGTP pyrophosphatase MutT (NUDIX family)